MKSTTPFVLLCAAIVTWGALGATHAQTAKSKARAGAAQTAPETPQGDTGDAASGPPQQGWAARCSTVSRDAPLECAMEQTAVLQKTGQLIILVNIRVPSDTRMPVALVQLPLGLNLPGGAKMQVDEGRLTDLQIQTCEARGCYAGTPVGPDLLAALRSGKQLKISFQNLGKETITIPLPLGDFAAAYDKIK